MNCFYIAVMVFLNGFVGDTEKILPSYVKTCHRNDVNLSACWKDSMVSLIPHLTNGIPEMGLRSFDPILIQELKVDFGGTKNINFNANLKNVKLYGCANMNVRDAAVVYSETGIIVKLNLTFPALYLNSIYKAKGQVLLLNFDSSGKFTANYSNTELTGFWKSNNVLKNGEVHGVFDESFVKVDLGSVHVEFDNLIRNNAEINANINKIINENIDILYNEIKPLVENVIDTLVTESINTVYNLFSMDILYPV